MSVKPILLSLCLLYLLVKGEANTGYSRASVVLRNDDGSIRGFHSPYNESDFFLGVLTRIHFALSGGKTCSQNFASRGLESIEAILFAIDAINNNSELLPNITLGYDVRDTCNNEVVAIDQTLDWIECSAIDETCFVDSKVPRSTFVGAIGASSSSVSIPPASFYRVFTVPQISYTSTSPLLSDKECYPYFLRTVPPDTAQAQAMVDIVREFGWSIVTTVHSNDAYGEEGINAFHNLAKQNGICIDLDEGLDRDFEDRDYQRVALELITNSTANVIVFFSFEGHVTSLLRQLQALNSHR